MKLETSLAAILDPVFAGKFAPQARISDRGAKNRQIHFAFKFFPYHSRSSFSRLVCVLLGAASSLYWPCSMLQPFFLAGNDTTNGGGDGFSALATGLYGVRSPWPVPTGGYLLLTHDGCQLWYLDTAGIIHLLLNGSELTHSGAGAYFYNPSVPKISEGRAVTMDYDGNLLICESDYGYIRRIRFQRIPPPE